MHQKPVRLLLADDHRMIREGLRALLCAQPGVEVVGEAADGRSAVRMAAELAPDVVVMDISMPDLNGIEATRQIRSGNGRSPGVIALSAHFEKRYATEMPSAGATGFVIKHSAFEELSLALKAVVTDKVYLSPAVSEMIVDGVRSGAAPTGPTAFSSCRRGSGRCSNSSPRARRRSRWRCTSASASRRPRATAGTSWRSWAGGHRGADQVRSPRGPDFRLALPPPATHELRLGR